MSSKTAQSELRRTIRHDNMNTKARRARQNRGTTPRFPVHTPEADANQVAASARASAERAALVAAASGSEST